MFDASVSYLLEYIPHTVGCTQWDKMQQVFGVCGRFFFKKKYIYLRKKIHNAVAILANKSVAM